MKIGILTFSKANNYGAVLQSYASQNFLKRQGHEAILIDYTPEVVTSQKKEKTGKTRWQNHFYALRHPFKTISRKKRNKKFECFREKKLQMSKKKYAGNVKSFENLYDCLIAGSDQIWNTDLNQSNSTFYLAQIDSAKKIAYAASVGRTPLTKMDKELLHKYVRNFSEITVRERSLRDYLEREEGVKTVLVCDPVFLLEQGEWSKQCVLPSKYGYILVYSMEGTKVLKDVVECVAQKYKKDIFIICGGGKINAPGKQINGVGPQEFLGWIKNADIVITNSFHGAAFSILFGKELYIVAHTKRNERMKQLVDHCGFSELLISESSIADFGDCKINGAVAYRNMQGLIEMSRAKLIEMCEVHK